MKKEKRTENWWLPKRDLELFGQFLYQFKNTKYGTLNWSKDSFVSFCKKNKIQQKGTSAKRSQYNHFWFSTLIPKGEKINDTAHHFLRHIRNAYAHCNINIEYEGRNRNKFYILKDYEMNKELSMSGKIRSDLLWEMINLLYS